MENQYFRAQSNGNKLPVLMIAVCCFIGFFCFYAKASHKNLILNEYELQLSEFNLYLERFSKSYKESEQSFRFRAFRDNLSYIRIQNSFNKDWKLGVNQFADLTPQEFSAMLTLKVQERPKTLKSQQNYSYPASTDWRLRNAVTTPKNQGFCGSCWAFSATGAIEGLYAIKGKGLPNLSKQQLVDCSKSFGNQGCGGGWMDFAFEYAMRHQIVSEEIYPYQGSEKICQYSRLSSGNTITGYDIVEPENVDALAFAISKQPVSVAADAKTWQLYQSGIITANCGTDLDHGVLAVGYHFGETEKYWIIKNSWGNYWGEQGYLRIAITQNGPGLCGIQMVGSYPTILK